jgi:hypothetical protein
LRKTTRTNAPQGTRREMHNAVLIEGALLLAKAGLLDGL